MDRLGKTVQDVGNADTPEIGHAELTAESNEEFTKVVDISDSSEWRIGMEANPEEYGTLDAVEETTESKSRGIELVTGEGMYSNDNQTSTSEELDRSANRSAREHIGDGLETNAYNASYEKSEHSYHIVDEILKLEQQYIDSQTSVECVYDAFDKSEEELDSHKECIPTKGRSVAAVSSCIHSGSDLDNSVIPINNDNMHCDNLEDDTSFRDGNIVNCLQTDEEINQDMDSDGYAHSADIEGYSLVHKLTQDIVNRTMSNLSLACTKNNYDENGNKHDVIGLVHMKTSDSVENEVLCNSAIDSLLAEGYIASNVDFTDSKMLPICDKYQTEPYANFTPDVMSVSSDSIPALANTEDDPPIDLLKNCAEVPICKPMESIPALASTEDDTQTDLLNDCADIPIIQGIYIAPKCMPTEIIPALASTEDDAQIDLLKDCAEVPPICKPTESGSAGVQNDVQSEWTNTVSIYEDSSAHEIDSHQDCIDKSSTESKIDTEICAFENGCKEEADVLKLCHLDESDIGAVDCTDDNIIEDALCRSNHQTCVAKIPKTSTNRFTDDCSIEVNQVHAEPDDTNSLQELEGVKSKHSEKASLPEVSEGIVIERNNLELIVQEVSNRAVLAEIVSEDRSHSLELDHYQCVSVVEDRNLHTDILIEEQIQDIVLEEGELNVGNSTQSNIVLEEAGCDAGNSTQSDIVEEMKDIREELQTFIDDTQTTDIPGPPKDESTGEGKLFKKSKSSRKRKKQQQKLAKLLEKHSTQHSARGKQKFALSFVELSRPLYESEDYDVDKSLTCPVCLEMLYLPTVCHPCRHTYCDTCLRRLTGQGTHDLPCPLCRTIIQSCTRDTELDEHLMIMHPDLYSSRSLTERRNKFRCFPLPYTPPEPLGRRFVRHLVASRMTQSDTGWMSHGWIKFLLGCTVGACATLLIMVLNRVKSLQDARDVNIMFLSLLFGSGLSYVIFKFVLK